MAILYADGSSSADGRIIQVVRGHISGNNTRTQTNAPNSWKKNVSSTDEVAQVYFTPKAATSKLLLVATGNYYFITGTEGHAGEAEVRIYDNTSSNQIVIMQKVGYSHTGGHNRDGDNWTLTALIEADHNSNGTNQRQYWTEYWFDGNQTFYYGQQGDSITVYEISASS